MPIAIFFRFLPINTAVLILEFHELYYLIDRQDRRAITILKKVKKPHFIKLFYLSII